MRSVPESVTVAQVLDATTDDILEEVGERLLQCERCPDTGGGCYAKLNEGERPHWVEKIERHGGPGFDWVACERWEPYLLDRRMLAWGFPRLMLRKTFDDYLAETDSEQKAVELLRDYVADFYDYAMQGAGVAMSGDVGVGKTTLACAVCRILLSEQKIRSARYWDAANLLAALRPTDNDQDQRRQTVHDCMRCAVFVLDDLGAHNTTDWVREQVGLIVNHRWSNGLPTIVTTNTSVDDAERSLGARTISRLLHNALTVDIQGKDRRAGW